MRTRIRVLTAWLCALCSCGDSVAPMTDGGRDAIADSSASPSDASPDARAPNACEISGGTCVPAARNGSPPGFTFTCPDGLVSPNGTPMWLGPGSDLLNNGCTIGSGFEPSLSGCCVAPRDR